MSNIFRDEYTDFTFNGVRSSQMKVWITNSRDIMFRLTPEFTDNFVSPSYGNVQLLNSTNKNKSSYPLKCIAIDITMQDWRAIQQWLSPDSVGRLEFDFNDRTYYNAKISKAITGTTFVRGTYDRLIGDLYIIEFSLEFTTVDDFAALGMVNVGILGKGFRSSLDDNGTTNNTDDDYLYTISSVSNNKFYMPSIIKEDINSIALNVPVKINSRPIKITVTSEDDEGSAIVYNPSIGIDNKIVQLFTISYTAVKDEQNNNFAAKITIIAYQYDQSLAKNNNNSITYENVHNPFTLYGDNLLIYVTSGSFEFADELSTYYICNTGAYEMYPHVSFTPITSSGETEATYTIQHDKQILYQYNMECMPLDIDGRNGIALCNGTIAENAYWGTSAGDIQNPIVRSSVNNGIFRIPSGRPELVKIRILEQKEVFNYTTVTEAASPIQNFTYIKILVCGDLKYQRYDNAIMHCFLDIGTSHSYNTSLYPASAAHPYEPQYYNTLVDSQLLRNCVLTPLKENQYSIMGPSIELSSLKVGKEYYLSVCDASTVQIDGGAGYIYLQTRDAF